MVVYIAVDLQGDGQWRAQVTEYAEIFAYGSSFNDAANKANDLLHRALASQAQAEKTLLETEDDRRRVFLSDDPA